MAGRTVYRQQLDTTLANVASGLRNMLDEASDAGRLADWLANVTQADLEVPADQAGFGYTTDEAYAVKLFGDYLAKLVAVWHGASVEALTPSMVRHAAEFTGLD